MALRFKLDEYIPGEARITGRAASNLTRSLHTLEHCGLVELKPATAAPRAGVRAPLKPVVLADGLDLELSF